MILFFFGADTFRSRQYLKEQVGRFKSLRDPKGYNTLFLDGKKESAGKIFSEISASPFLAEKRMVVIENVLSSSDKDLLGKLCEFVNRNKIENQKSSAKGGSASGGKIENVIIFWQGEALSKVKEAKELDAVLKKEKYAQEFEILTGAKLTAWVKKEVETKGGKIDPPALSYLCQHCGHDIWRMGLLVDQLIAYCQKTSLPTAPSPSSEGLRAAAEVVGQNHSIAMEGSRLAGAGEDSPRDIQIADIQLFIEEKIDDNVFSMVDAVVQGNHKLAYKLLNHQRDIGEEDGKIFGLLVWQFRILLEMGEAFEDGIKTSDDLARQLGINPFVARKNLAIINHTPLSKLHYLYKALLDIDIKTKTGIAPINLSLDLLVAKV